MFETVEVLLESSTWSALSFMSAPFLCKALIYSPNEDFKLLVKIRDLSGPETPDFSVLVVI